MKKLLSFTLLVLLSAGFFASCKKDNEVPPAVPPLSTMKIDFSNFTSDMKSAMMPGSENETKGVTNGNYQFAASVAGFWNLLLTLNLVIPVASYTESFNHTPVYIENRTWQWTYSVNVLAGTYKARLTGQIRDNDVKWEMYISKEGAGAFSEFRWFDGTSALNGNSGQWILYHSVAFPEPMLQIDWTKVDETVGSIKYTYVRVKKDDRTTDPANGSYIEYGLQNSSLNAFYNIHLFESVYTNSFANVFIEWNTTTHNGHVKAFYKYSDNNWHCWDANGNDIVCN
jgi:hypothetical protein